MSVEAKNAWTRLRPPFSSATSCAAFMDHARALLRARKDPEAEDAVEEVRSAFVEQMESYRDSDRQVLLAAGLVVSDLVIQGWQLRVRRTTVEVCPPIQVSHDRASEKARVRRQELVKRDAQLSGAAVQKFVGYMERPRLFNGKFVSIFSLMRDGRELADSLRRAREHRNNGWAGALASVVDPYIQFVSSDKATCGLTGLRLMEIWRYFRHTWTNQYTNVPGRTMLFLVRDRAVESHPIIGIGALSSPVMQIRERDTWIGWHPDTFLATVRANPTLEYAQWLVRTVDKAIAELYIDDLRADLTINAHDLSDPTEDLIERLLDDSALHRRLHHRFVRSRDHKSPRRNVSDVEHWIARAQTHLFRSKRALALASHLRARATLKREFGDSATPEKLASLVATGAGSDAVRKILKKAKADRVGIALADITVCGAVQPYNAILGGKLVAMLTTSPEVVLEYRRRYSAAESEIASSMAGRAIVRPPVLVLLGTTSLYGVGSSQYNRITIPCDRLGGLAGEEIRYTELGHSQAFGTSQYSEETVEALVNVVQQSAGGQRVNSIFGEGVSPKLRKVRQGLDALALPSGLLLRHHRRRIVYAVSLIRNLREHLLGFEPQPQYLVPLEDAPGVTSRIAVWWRERWLRNRILSDEVLEEVARHTLVRPVSHGARVVVPSSANDQAPISDLF